MAVCFFLAGKTSARSGRTARRLRTTDDVHGPVVRQVVWSPQCCGSCRLVASHESHSRTGFGMHSTRDGTCGLMFCLVEEVERQNPSQDGISVFSLNFTVLSRGKGGLVEESERQDPSRDSISVFSLNSRVLSWGKGRRTKIGVCPSYGEHRHELGPRREMHVGDIVHHFLPVEIMVLAPEAIRGNQELLEHRPII